MFNTTLDNMLKCFFFKTNRNTTTEFEATSTKVLLCLTQNSPPLHGYLDKYFVKIVVKISTKFSSLIDLTMTLDREQCSKYINTY